MYLPKRQVVSYLICAKQETLVGIVVCICIVALLALANSVELFRACATHAGSSMIRVNLRCPD